MTDHQDGTDEESGRDEPRAEALVLSAVSIVAGAKLVYEIARNDVLPRLKSNSEAVVFLDDCFPLPDTPDHHRLLLRFANLSVHGMYIERVSLIRPSDKWKFSLFGVNSHGHIIYSTEAIDAELKDIVSTNLHLRAHSELGLALDFKLHPVGDFQLSKDPYGEVKIWYRSIADYKGMKEVSVRFSIRIPHSHTPNVKLISPSKDSSVTIVSPRRF